MTGAERDEELRRVGPARRLLPLAYLGFVSLGLPDTVLGAAWPALRAELGLALDAAGAALLATTLGVVLSSTTSAWLRARIGTGSVLVASTWLAALGLLVTALAPGWAYVLAAALLAGLGGGAIDASLNDYVARHYSARHVTWLHACWGVGAATAPLVVASALGAGASWRWAYGALGALEALLSLAFLATWRAWSVEQAAPPMARERRPGALRTSALASVALFALYAGLEAGTGLWAASWLISARGLSPGAAGALLATYWAALTGGRFVIGAWTRRMSAARLLRAAVWGAWLVSALLCVPDTPVWFAAGALGLLGFSLAPIYPLVMHDTPARFGAALGARLVGYQVAAATVGVAVLPWLIGVLAKLTSPHWIPGAWLLLAALVVAAERARRCAAR